MADGAGREWRAPSWTIMETRGKIVEFSTGLVAAAPPEKPA
jgi:hypothetical protein